MKNVIEGINMTIKERMEMGEKYSVKDFVIENTGGNVYVAWGSFENGFYFAISSDLVMIYDMDEYKAMETEEYQEDSYKWELKHVVESYSYEMPQYKYIQLQIYNRCSNYEKMVDIFSDIEDEDNE